MSWLWDSMIPEISRNCMFLPTFKDISEALQKWYSKKQDLAAVYALQTKITAMKQKISLSQSSLLKGLWLELDHYQSLKMVCTEDAKTLASANEENKITNFPAWCNVQFNQIRNQLLGKMDCLPINEVLATLHGEESRRAVMFEQSVTDGSTSKGNSKNRPTQ